MRGLKSTIALLAVLGGLGAYIYFVTSKIEPKDETKTVKVFPALEADAIDGMQITSDKGPTTTVEKKDDKWQISGPEAIVADETEITAVANGLAAVEVGRTIEENAAKLEDYGLATPRLDVAFKTAKDPKYKHLFVGEKTATGGDAFAKLEGSNKVFLIPAYQEMAFDKGPFDLRDKTLLEFERDKLQSVEVNNAGASFTLAKTGDADWSITKPAAFRADPSAVEGLRARLETGQMKSIVKTGATAADLKDDGLDKPARSVVLNFGGTATVQFGGTAPDGGVYTRVSTKPDIIVTVDAAMADDVTKAAPEYRLKDIFDFRPFSATAVTFVRGNNASLPFEKVKGEAKDGKEAEDTWRRLGPNPVDAPKEPMDNLLTRLTTMKAISFVDSLANTGLDKPELTVEAKFGEGKQERVSFGRVGNNVYAQRPGEPGAAKVDDTEYAEAYKSLLDLAK